MLAGASAGVDDFVAVDQHRAAPEDPPGGPARGVLAGSRTLREIGARLGRLFLKRDSRERQAPVFDIRDLDVLIRRTGTLGGGIAHGHAYYVRAGPGDGNVNAVDHAFFQR